MKQQRMISMITALALCSCMYAAPAAHALQADPSPQALFGETESYGPVFHAEGDIPTPTEVYNAMIALQKDPYFAEDAPWTNETHNYKWNGGTADGIAANGAGCVAFAYQLSDEAFGSLPARMLATGQFAFSDVKVGDILRVNSDAHTVIVIQITDGGVIIAEGNYHENGSGGKVHWGRAMSKAEVEAANHYITRYPVGYIPPDDPTANDPIEGGSDDFGTGLHWELTKAGTLTISGSGAMPDFSMASEQPWNAHNDKILKIVVKDGVTSIGNCAFWGSSVLGATIADSVTSIGNDAFKESSIVSVSVPSSVKSIGNDAFRSCTNLVSATIPEGVETIGERTFQGCKKLTSIALPASITSVGAGTFMECTELTHAVFAPSDKQVQLGDNLFIECWKLSSVTLPQKINTIGSGMFMNCHALSNVTIPQGAEMIGDLAFSSSAVTSISIPASVTSIGTGAFRDCRYLTNIYFEGTEAQWNSIRKLGDVQASLSSVTIHYGEYEPDLGHTHEWSSAWETDATHHWHECTAADCTITDNSAKDGYGEHEYANGSCTVCGYASSEQPGHIHSWATAWESNDTHHWHECTAAGCDITANSEKNGYGEHVYDNDTDATCNTCDYIREIQPPEHEHEWASEWSSNAASHWHECTAEGCTLTDNTQKDGYGTHVYDDTEDLSCNICGFERTPEQAAHEHEWDTEWSENDTHHWHKCIAENCYITDDADYDGYAEHVYTDDEDESCNECGHIRQLAHKHDWASEWSSNSTHHWHECDAKDCDITSNSDKDGYASHSYGSWVIDEEATEDESGSRHRTCTVCGYRQTDEIPAVEPADRPNRGSGTASRNPSNTSSSTGTNRNPDGSVTTTKTDSSTGTVTATTEHPDGSQTVVETRKDGTVTTRETDSSGNRTETVARPDGSSTVTVAQKDGTTASVTTDTSGRAEAEVRLSASAVSAARQNGDAVPLPIPAVPVARSSGAASTITVSTGSGETTNVAIPAVLPTIGTVAVIVRADGTETVVKTSVPMDGAVAVPLPDGATVKLVDNSREFSDVSDRDWAQDAIRFVTARELFEGTTATTFSPEAPMTRAMLITVLARFDGADTTGGAVWYDKAIEWAVAKGISDGSSPNDSITREQLVTMLWRYAGSPAAGDTLSGFTDLGQLNTFAQESMRWAVQNGIIGGYSDGRLAPQGQATRAQVAQILMNFIRK